MYCSLLHYGMFLLKVFKNSQNFVARDILNFIVGNYCGTQSQKLDFPVSLPKILKCQHNSHVCIGYGNTVQLLIVWALTFKLRRSTATR
jgi:hypothetical protein